MQPLQLFWEFYSFFHFRFTGIHWFLSFSFHLRLWDPLCFFRLLWSSRHWALYSYLFTTHECFLMWLWSLSLNQYSDSHSTNPNLYRTLTVNKSSNFTIKKSACETTCWKVSSFLSCLIQLFQDLYYFKPAYLGSCWHTQTSQGFNSQIYLPLSLSPYSIPSARVKAFSVFPRHNCQVTGPFSYCHLHRAVSLRQFSYWTKPWSQKWSVKASEQQQDTMSRTPRIIFCMRP